MLSALFWSRLPFQVPYHKSPSAQIFAGIRAFWFIPQLISRAHHFLTYPLLCDSARISPTPAFPLAFSISAQCLEAALTCCPHTQTWPGCAAKGLAHHTPSQSANVDSHSQRLGLQLYFTSKGHHRDLVYSVNRRCSRKPTEIAVEDTPCIFLQVLQETP